MRDRRTSMKIVRAVEAFGTATIDDLLLLYPEHSRSYISKALSNAGAIGLIRLIERRNKRSGLWAPVGDATPCITSVWDLAEPKPVHLPVIPGRQFTPLGPWSELEGAAAA